MRIILLISFLFITSFLTAEENYTALNKNSDAASDKNLFTSSAETLNQGEVTINNYEIAVFGISVGATDNLELSLSTTPVIPDNIVLLGSMKYKLFNSESSNVSIQLSQSYVYEYNEDYYNDDYDDNDDDDDARLTVISILYDFMPTKRVTIGLGFRTYFNSETELNKLNIMTSLAISVKLFKYLNFLGEVISLHEPSDEDSKSENLFGFGFRTGNNFFAMDLAFVKFYEESDLFPYATINFKF